jgi:hypothetical protein
MPISSTKYHTTLANYLSAQSLFFNGDLQKKPHIRNCMELPFQQTKARLWNEVTDTFCDLEFIQAKVRYKYQTPRGLEDTLGFKGTKTRRYVLQPMVL